MTSTRLALALLATPFLALAGCAHGAASAAAPAPAAAPTPVAAATAADPTPATPATAADAGRQGGAAEVTTEDVVRQAVKVFGDSIAPTPEAVALEDTADAPTWDIDVQSYEGHQRVAYYVSRFAGEARERFEASLSRGSRYEPMIRAKLHAAGLPEDMYYLALIESGFNTNAYSRAAAVGLWQLMTSTAQGVGLRVDWWVDERRDPVRSTDAAIRFLKYLNEQFGSLYLAAAAYNGGPGRIARGLTRYADDFEGTTGDDLFFALAEKGYLRNETREYVPQLIAAALVAKEPERYGLTVHELAPYAYDSVSVPGATPLAAVARAAGVSLADVVELNPQLLRGMTPPRTTWRVRVPAGKGAGFDSAFAALPKAERTAYKRVLSKKGDTPAALARRNGIAAHQLKWYNPHLEVSRRTGRLVPGQVIIVPTEAVVAAAHDVPDPAVEIYGASRRGRTIYHTVRAGENLDRIARRYGTTSKAIMRLNGLRKSIIFPGQTLVVKAGGSSAGHRAAKPSQAHSKKKRASRRG